MFVYFYFCILVICLYSESCLITFHRYGVRLYLFIYSLLSNIVINLSIVTTYVNQNKMCSRRVLATQREWESFFHWINIFSWNGNTLHPMESVQCIALLCTCVSERKYVICIETLCSFALSIEKNVFSLTDKTGIQIMCGTALLWCVLRNIFYVYRNIWVFCHYVINPFVRVTPVCG